MTTSGPVLPSSSDPAETTVAAEPGSGGPAPQFEEEPDIIFEPETNEPLDDASGDQGTVFRTPTPGQGLSPEEFAADEG